MENKNSKRCPGHKGRISRRSFLKTCGLAVAAPSALLKEGKRGVPKLIDINKKFGETSMRFFTEMRYYAVPNDEWIYFDYLKIGVEGRKPVASIPCWSGDMEFIYNLGDDVLFSEIPIPRHYITFISDLPLGRGDIIEITYEPQHLKHKDQYIIF